MKAPVLATLLISVVAVASAQNVSSSVNGSLADPTRAAIGGAEVKLTRHGTGSVLTTRSDSEGLFTFPNVGTGVYDLSVQQSGFKALAVQDIAVSASEIRSLGRLTLQIGEVREAVSVTAEVTPLQLSSAERSGTVTGAQINNLALKGRDFFALLQTIPGVVDTAADTRETTSNQPQRGIYINGTRENQKNVSVDGVTAMDTHSNGSATFQPNMDSIEEVRILTSNYQAEYGRNGGGSITAITKSGNSQFHGSGYNFYRHESLNATNFFLNRSGTRKLPYRYRISGYSIGGPVFLPGRFNTNKDKLFFFWSQEYTGVKADYGAVFANMPTQLERNGDFSRSFDVNGALIRITDPSTGQPFPGNVMPQNRISKLGQSMLNFFPLPNYTDPDPRNLYNRNHRDTYSGATPRRNDILRLDYNASQSLRLYYRYGLDVDDTFIPWGDRIGNTNFLISPVFVDRSGKGHLVNLTKTFSPTLVNEFRFGASYVVRDYDFVEPAKLMRSLMGNPPEWFDDKNPAINYIPTVQFGGQPANPIAAPFNSYLPNRYRNPVYAITDNLSKILGRHSLKTGFYFERTLAETPGNGSYRGTFNFSRDVNNPFDSGHSYSNTMLGNFASYTEHEKRFSTRQRFFQIEWYVQDNWRVSNRLTLDIGLRFSQMAPMRELDNQAAAFNPALYDRSKAPLLYVPALDGSRRLAKDPRTGAFAPAPLIGLYVPGTGDTANGSVIGGINGVPPGLYDRPLVNLAPRFGFAYDLFGDGKTAMRGGWGWFFDTGQNNPFSATIGSPPVYRQPILYYSNLDSYASSGGATGPQSVTTLYGKHQTPNTMNFSFGIQKQIWDMVIDASYVGSLSRNLYVIRPINPIPMFGRFDPANQDPTLAAGRPLPDNFFRPFPGLGDVSAYEHIATANYHSFQLSVNRRWSRGLQYGVSYTRGKTLGLSNNDTTSITPYFDFRQRNYGPLSFDRTHVLVLHYIYELPRLGKRLGSRPLGWIVDNWQVSGITSLISGSPFTPGFSTVDGQDITGSSEGARINVVANPNLSQSERTFFRNFNTDAFRRPALRDFGNAGVGILRGPGTNNWDLNINKRIPLFAESRYIQFRTELFNAWNHTQFSGLFSTARFDAQGRQVDANFGAFSSARPPRTIQLSLKVVF